MLIEITERTGTRWIDPEQIVQIRPTAHQPQRIGRFVDAPSLRDGESAEVLFRSGTYAEVFTSVDRLVDQLRDYSTIKLTKERADE